jgi:hypothetical protein
VRTFSPSRQRTGFHAREVWQECALVGFVGGDILLIGIKPTEIDASDFTAI